jgi:hypothetical protein
MKSEIFLSVHAAANFVSQLFLNITLNLFNINLLKSTGYVMHQQV